MNRWYLLQNIFTQNNLIQSLISFISFFTPALINVPEDKAIIYKYLINTLI